MASRAVPAAVSEVQQSRESRAVSASWMLWAMPTSMRIQFRHNGVSASPFVATGSRLMILECLWQAMMAFTLSSGSFSVLVAQSQPHDCCSMIEC